MSSGLIAALMMRAGFSWKSISHTEQECIIEVRSATGEVLGEVGFTIQDAQRADLIRKNANWNVYPKDMLFARTISAAARRFAPVAFGGAVYTPDELQDSDKPANPRRLPVERPAQVVDIVTNPDTGEIVDTIPPAKSHVSIDFIKLCSLTDKELKLTDDERRAIILEFTDNRTNSRKD